MRISSCISAVILSDKAVNERTLSTVAATRRCGGASGSGHAWLESFPSSASRSSISGQTAKHDWGLKRAREREQKINEDTEEEDEEKEGGRKSMVPCSDHSLWS